MEAIWTQTKSTKFYEKTYWRIHAKLSSCLRSCSLYLHWLINRHDSVIAITSLISRWEPQLNKWLILGIHDLWIVCEFLLIFRDVRITYFAIIRPFCRILNIWASPENKEWNCSLTPQWMYAPLCRNQCMWPTNEVKNKNVEFSWRYYYETWGFGTWYCSMTQDNILHDCSVSNLRFLITWPRNEVQY